MMMVGIILKSAMRGRSPAHCAPHLSGSSMLFMTGCARAGILQVGPSSRRDHDGGRPLEAFPLNAAGRTHRHRRRCDQVVMATGNSGVRYSSWKDGGTVDILTAIDADGADDSGLAASLVGTVRYVWAAFVVVGGGWCQSMYCHVGGILVPAIAYRAGTRTNLVC